MTSRLHAILIGLTLVAVRVEIDAAPSVDIDGFVLEKINYADEYADNYIDRKYKRQTPDAEEIVPRLPITSEKVKELLRMLNKPKKSEFLKLNGWSASGMPFNVLYTPNTLQQKFLSSLQNLPERKPVPQPLRKEEYTAERREDKKKYTRNGTKPSLRSPQMRKHYLVIPQLFVSYGWGSVGK